MKKPYLFLLLLFFTCNLISQNANWEPISIPNMKGLITKQDGNISYLVDSTTYIPDRDEVIRKTKEYISQNMDMINESGFDEPISIFLGRETDYFGRGIFGMVTLKNEEMPSHIISSVYGPLRSSLKSELMQLIAQRKWGEQKDDRLKWLTEGLATYANPGAFSYDGHNFEERYAYFMQTGKLFPSDSLMTFSLEDVMPGNKIAYCQAAYIVEYLIRNYGIDKIKALWTTGMDSFVPIYDFTFEDLIVKITRKLEQKYAKPMEFNWKEFNSDCFASQYNEWLPLYPYLYRGLEGMVSKVDGNIRYTVDSTRSIAERNYIIEKTKKSIAENLELVNESGFDDFVHIIVVKDTIEMRRHMGRIAGGMALVREGINKDIDEFKEHTIHCVYKEAYFPVKHELMHMITWLHWGVPPDISSLLSEGIASFADPDAFNCNGHSYEEKYIYSMQNNKLLSFDELMIFSNKELNKGTMGYLQSAYIVEYLLKNYGLDKFKLVWKSGMANFEKIYGLTFDEMTVKIKEELEKKYPDPIESDEKEMIDSCYK